MNNFNFVSLVIPAFRSEKTIIENLKVVENALSLLPYKFEIIVVVDGFLDKTYEIAKTFKSKNIRVLGYQKNQGKGYAVKFGMSKAKGDIIGFMDAGLDLNPNAIPLLLDLMKFHNADIIVGSKLHPESKVDYPFRRRVMSWGYRTLIELLFGLSVRDTQVGLKFFKKEVVKAVFPRLLVKNFAFDIEVLAVSRAKGFTKIYEGPVDLNFNNKSSIGEITSINFWKIIYLMLWDTMAVFYRLRILNYYSKR